MPSGFEMSWPKAKYNDIKFNFASYLNIKAREFHLSIRHFLYTSIIITCAENMKENALLVFQNTAGYRTEYTTKAKA